MVEAFFFGHVDGTLSLGLALYKVDDASLTLTKTSDLLKALKNDFEKAFDKQTREESGVELPESYNIKNISGEEWAEYVYFIDNGKHIVYAHSLDDKHYIMVTFNFIDNSEGKINDWKEKAQATVNFVMSSFLIK